MLSTNFDNKDIAGRPRCLSLIFVWYKSKRWSHGRERNTILCNHNGYAWVSLFGLWWCDWFDSTMKRIAFLLSAISPISFLSHQIVLMIATKQPSPRSFKIKVFKKVIGVIASITITSNV